MLSVDRRLEEINGGDIATRPCGDIATRHGMW